jgi:hypothetical protein
MQVVMKKKRTSDGMQIVDAITGKSKKMAKLVKGAERTHAAEALVYDLIELEIVLRRLANRVQVYRRSVQEGEGLVLTHEEVEQMVKEGAKRIEDVATGKVKGLTEAKFQERLKKLVKPATARKVKIKGKAKADLERMLHELESGEPT